MGARVTKPRSFLAVLSGGSVSAAAAPARDQDFTDDCPAGDLGTLGSIGTVCDRGTWRAGEPPGFGAREVIGSFTMDNLS